MSIRNPFKLRKDDYKGMDLRPIAEMLAGSNPAPDNSIFL